MRLSTHTAVEAIYDAAAEPGRWPAALDAIAGSVGGVGTVLMMRRPDGGMTTIVSPVLAAAAREYEAGAWRLDFMVPRAIEHGIAASAACYTDRDLATADEIATHPFYTDFRMRHGLGPYIGALVSPHPKVPVILTLQGAFGQVFSVDDVEAFASLARHVEKSVRLTLRLQEAELGRLALGGALSRLACGAILVDAAGHVTFSNAAAERLLGGGLCRKDGRLNIIGAGRARGATAYAEPRLLRPGILQREGTSNPPIIVETPAGGSAAVYAIPLRHPAVVEASHDDTDFSRSRLLVLLVEQAADEPADPALLRDVLGLTLGEARVAALVAAGHTPREASEALEISEHTTRTVLKRVFAKVGVSRQAELAILLSRLALRSGD